VNRSQKFWGPYLKFEMDLLNSTTPASEEEQSKQIGRIRSIYRRRVMFPTSDMLMTWGEYQEWEVDSTELARVKERYEQATAKIDVMVNFEEKFQQAYMASDES
jgi:hypothetical protein